MSYDFSVIVPTYARPAQLSACLDALWRLDYPADRFEVIVVDDGTPAPLDALFTSRQSGPELRWIYKTNGGPGSARNAGAAIARGRYLAFTDDDCLPDPGWLREFGRVLERRPDCIVGGLTLNDLEHNTFSEASQLIVDLVYAHYNSEPERARFFASNNMAISATSFRELGGFEELNFRDASEDRELCDRWRHEGRELCFASRARIAHGHRLSLRRFCRQHFNYGRGASHYHRARAERGSGRMHQEMSFHLHLPRLLYAELRKRGLRRMPALLLLLGVWQTANAAGFGYETVLAARRHARPHGRLGFERSRYASAADAGPVALRGVERGPAGRLPLVVEPLGAGPDVVCWARENREFVRGRSLAHGALLFRGFSLPTPKHLEELIEATCDDGSSTRRDRAAPRTGVRRNVDAASETPSDGPIFLHNESSFCHSFPRKLFLHCRTPATLGGETPLADVRRVFERIDPEIRARFAAEGVLYRRNFRPGRFGPDWKEAFGVSDRAQLEAHCRSASIDFEWVGEDHLRTTERRPAIARHPETGDFVWFNHACAFNVGTLPDQTRHTLQRIFREEELPANSYYGDGAPIEPDVLEAVCDAYRAEAVAVEWQRGDVLLLDNMLVAHGRGAYSGPREIVVGMAEPTCWQDVVER